MVTEVEGLGFRVSGLGLTVQGLCFSIQGLGSGSCLGFRVSGLEFGVALGEGTQVGGSMAGCSTALEQGCARVEGLLLRCAGPHFRNVGQRFVRGVQSFAIPRNIEGERAHSVGCH